MASEKQIDDISANHSNYGLVLTARACIGNCAFWFSRLNDQVRYGSVYQLGAPYQINPANNDRKTIRLIRSNKRIEYVGISQNKYLSMVTANHGIILPGIMTEDVLKPKNLKGTLTSDLDFYRELGEAIYKYHERNHG